MRDLPPPLPPETRTVGQLVAETIRLYGENFWRALPLGLGLALIDQVSAGRSYATQTLVFCAGAPLMTAAYVGAVRIAGRVPTTLTAFTAGVLVFLPAPILLRLYVLPAFAWLALFGLCVPAAMIERLGFRGTLARGRALALADYVHALGSLATLGIVFFLSRYVLIFLLRGQGDAALRVALFVGDLVLSPLLFLGGALLYFDQAARVRSGRPRRRSRDADLHPALDADPAGRPDAEIQP